jgi:Flp pilus assembly protein TadB
MPGGRDERGNPGDWRVLLPLAVFLVAWAVVTIMLGLVVLSVIFLLGAASVGFMAGYLYRADLQRLGKTPRFRFLQVEGDRSDK